jgi:hypothetical protein
MEVLPPLEPVDAGRYELLQVALDAVSATHPDRAALG